MKAYDLYKEFENAANFKNNIGLKKEITRSVMFENGKQWNMDEDIADYPKITLNVIKQIGKARKSNIMQNEYAYLVNSTNFASVRKIQDFLKYQARLVNMKRKDLKALSDDYTKGTAIGYFYWDAEKRGFMKKSGGEMRYEMIDIRNFFVANSYIQEIQDQEWVGYVTRERINSIKKKYKVEVQSDANLYTNGTEIEQTASETENEFANVYTKFYRNDEGQVFFVIFTETVILQKPTPLNPYYTGSSKEEPNTMSVMDEKEQEIENTKKKDKRNKHIWNLYPFVKLCLNERDNCFYGLPITLEYTESQKSINNHYSIYDKALQDNVLGGFVFRKGVLDEAEISTENGQLIGLDTMPNERIDGAFTRIPVANPPADSFNYSNQLIYNARTIAGASNVQLGMSDHSGQSGKQTQLLLERAKENSSDNATLFNEFKKDQAHIMFLFAKFFYDNESFSIINHGFQKDDAVVYRDADAFDGTKYLDDDVLIDIQVGSAPSFSEYSNIEMLGLMVQSGQAPFEAYISLLPEGFISNKKELLDIAKNNSLKQIQALNQQLEQAHKIMQQMTEQYEKTKKDIQNIDTIVKENERLKTMIAEISASSVKTVTDYSKQIDDLTKEMQNVLKIVNKNK